MTNSRTKHSLVVAAFGFLAPCLRRSLLDDQEFVDHWELNATAGVAIGKDGPCFRREELYRGMREAIGRPEEEVTIQDDKGNLWRLTARAKASSWSFVLADAGSQFLLEDHSGLAKEKEIRVSWFNEIAERVNFDRSERQQWMERLASRPLSDDEFARLREALTLTPVSTFENIGSGFSQRRVDLGTLVQGETRYYDLLIGSLGSASNTDEYINGGAAQLICDLQKWNSTSGFLYSLLMCSAGTIAARIGIEGFSSQELLGAYEWLADHGDPISQLGAVEVALRSIEEHRELEPFVERIIEAFISDDPEHKGGRFSLLSAIVVLVGSELSRRHVLGQVQPFYRKQAAIAQASLIIRAIYASEEKAESIVDWAKTSGFGNVFFLQGLVDLRLEPRWLPDFVSPYQLRAEFMGRISNAVERWQKGIKSESLRCLVVGEESRLATAVDWPFRMLPGPLEGEAKSEVPTISDDVLEDVASDLKSEYLEPHSFARLVNLASLFGMPASHAGLAATALRRVKYSIEIADSDDNLFGLIGGLATVAAVTRSTDLAEELRVLDRVMRRRKRLTVEAEDQIRIAMLAAASNEKLENWASFAGEWISELAFEVEGKESSTRLLHSIRRLVRAEPALARYCAVAEAALESAAW